MTKFTKISKLCGVVFSKISFKITEQQWQLAKPLLHFWKYSFWNCWQPTFFENLAIRKFLCIPGLGSNTWESIQTQIQILWKYKIQNTNTYTEDVFQIQIFLKILLYFVISYTSHNYPTILSYNIISICLILQMNTHDSLLLVTMQLLTYWLHLINNNKSDSLIIFTN